VSYFWLMLGKAKKNWGLDVGLGLERPPDQGLGSGRPLGQRAECLEGWELLEAFGRWAKGF
jgi:hypothetical protein